MKLFNGIKRLFERDKINYEEFLSYYDFTDICRVSCNRVIGKKYSNSCLRKGRYYNMK